jgi:N-acetylneuraminate synthase
MILSTGMASLDEIKAAVTACEQEGCRDITLLQCTSAYPADASDANLLTMRSMNIETGWPVGLSDHTPGIGVAVAAVALGAVMVEKHMTLSRADGGLDASFSMEPHEFKQMVVECRRAASASAIGTPVYGCGPNESTELRRSLYWAKDIKAGEVITAEHIRTARPALGAYCDAAALFVGETAKCSHKAGMPV